MDEQRGIDPGYEVFHVVINAMELQLNKTGEVNACQRRETSTGSIETRSRVSECKGNFLETG
jgi:hypothetical protein